MREQEPTGVLKTWNYIVPRNIKSDVFWICSLMDGAALGSINTMLMSSNEERLLPFGVIGGVWLLVNHIGLIPFMQESEN